jgi:hypothetical protein
LAITRTTVLAEAWLRDAAVAYVTAGELIAAERLERGNLRSRRPAVWKRAPAKKLRRWVLASVRRARPGGARPRAGCGGRLKLTNRW